jgi:glycosyltransferase involved in cell wall biosynthesis
MRRWEPLVSIVVPLYNKADVVEATLRCAAGQIDADCEIIVVDDGSLDGGGKLARDLGLPSLRVIEQANAGVSAARNRGIAAAAGKWIALLDADDLWSDDHVAGLLHAVEGTDAIAAFSNIRLQSRGGLPAIDVRTVGCRIEDYFSFALDHGGYPISSSSIMVLRSELSAAGLFAEGVTSGEDIDMWCRLACRGSFIYTATPSATYNDEQSPTHRNRGTRIVAPLFAQRRAELIGNGSLPSRMVESSGRYANFLMLEYARQLLDAARHAEARAVLLNDCIPRYDSWRFLKRLARTTSVGRSLFHLARGAL